MGTQRQLSLLGSGEPRIDHDTVVVRHQLDDTSWVDVGPTWLTGADDLYEMCTTALRWAQRRRPMFGELVLEPRLTATVPRPGTSSEMLSGAARTISTIADELSDRYGTPLRSVWANWYRDGDDAVAWHADRIGRAERNPLVAIVTLGGPRRFAMRPGSTETERVGRRWDLHSGDLLVMGGACQHRWEHTVPRRRGAPPRISLTFRASTAA